MTPFCPQCGNATIKTQGTRCDHRFVETEPSIGTDPVAREESTGEGLWVLLQKRLCSGCQLQESRVQYCSGGDWTDWGSIPDDTEEAK
jgi:hypothetical protein